MAAWLMWGLYLRCQDYKAQTSPNYKPSVQLRLVDLSEDDLAACQPAKVSYCGA